MKKTVLQVEGMECAHCEKAVTEALEKLEGVHKAKVSKRHKTAEVSYDEDKITPEKMAEVVTEAGYESKFS